MTFHPMSHILCAYTYKENVGKSTFVYVFVYLITLERYVNVCHTQQVILKQFILAVRFVFRFGSFRFQKFLFILFPNLIEFFYLLFVQITVEMHTVLSQASRFH